MKKTLLLLPLLLLLGCAPEPSANPRESAKIYISALLQGKWDDVCDMLDDPSRASLGPDCPRGAEAVWARAGEIYKESSPRIVSRQGPYAAAATGVVPRIVFLYREDDGLWLVTLFPPDSLERSLL